MNLDKIYVLKIDGSDVWVPINARQLTDNQFELLSDSEYDNLDSNELFQFFPGDIVTVEQHAFSDSTVRPVARRLIHRAPRQDREYLEFKFYATRKELPLDKKTADKYWPIIERIKKEKLAGQFFYPFILDTITELENVNH